jgi:hypothetical protein
VALSLLLAMFSFKFRMSLLRTESQNDEVMDTTEGVSPPPSSASFLLAPLLLSRLL